MSSPPEWGPEAVETVPVTTRTAHDATPTQATLRSHEGPAAGASPPVVAPGLDHDDDGARDDDDCEQKVGHHGNGVQLEQDGDPAERDLGDRAERCEQGENAHEAWQSVDAPRREPGDDREDDPDECDHAVPELDRGMPARLGVRLVPALRPVVTAEPGGGQADDGTARDDDPEREECDVRELKEPSRRDGATRAGRLPGGRR